MRSFSVLLVREQALILGIAHRMRAGFILTYILHTTHAAKNGSRAGLGVTLIQLGVRPAPSRSLSPSRPSR